MDPKSALQFVFRTKFIITAYDNHILKYTETNERILTSNQLTTQILNALYKKIKYLNIMYMTNKLSTTTTDQHNNSYCEITKIILLYSIGSNLREKN